MLCTDATDFRPCRSGPSEVRGRPSSITGHPASSCRDNAWYEVVLPNSCALQEQAWLGPTDRTFPTWYWATNRQGRPLILLNLQEISTRLLSGDHGTPRQLS